MLMFQVGDYVVLTTNGICKIVEETCQDWSGEDKRYFLLIPNDDSSSKVFIPIDKAEDRLRKVMTKEEAINFIEGIDMILPMQITNERQCEKEYKDAIHQMDCQGAVALLKTLYKRISERTASGKKATAVDERYCKIAENMLFSELAYALNTDIITVMNNIKKRC